MEKITVDLQKKGAGISPSMFGIFIEDINHACDGGLYAELVQNRGFSEAEVPEGFKVKGNRLAPPPITNHYTGEVSDVTEKIRWNTEPVRAWTLHSKDSAGASMKLTKDCPRFETAPTNLEVTIRDASQAVSLINEGYWGMGLKADEKYLLRVIIRASADYQGTVRVFLLSESGKDLASCPVKLSRPDEWNDVREVLTPTETDAKARLAVIFDAPGTIWLDYVSLFPEATYKERENGMRKDVAQMLVDMKPAFVRWPGGTVVGGITLNTRFEWKKTLGDPASRPGQFFTWGYRCSYGLGYYDLLQFCEDLGADAMFVCNVGLSDLFRMGEACSEEEIQFYIQDCLDAIEYALGDTSTTWGARRAADGHPAPFPLKYVEIGNEHWGKEYDRRFSIFYEALKKRYPQLTYIYNEVIFSSDTAKDVETDMIDPHFYEGAEAFYRNNGLFDRHPRGRYKVYVGEWACNVGVGPGNMSAALSEAAFIAGMERNGDLVKMTCYAPLFENSNDRLWATNLIWINSETVIGRSSYYVQKMASVNRPTRNVWSSFTQAKPEPETIKAGSVGFGSVGTPVEYKDIKITESGEAAQPGVPPADVNVGGWKIDGEVLSHSSSESKARYLLKGVRSNDFTLEFKARKLGGKEGFALFYGADDEGSNGYMVNIGGGGNLSTVVQRIENSAAVSHRIPHALENDRWYDLKLTVTPHEAKLYIDGKLALTHKAESVPLQFLSSGYDESVGEVVLKFVNGSATPYQAAFYLKGTTAVQSSGKVISLTGTSEEDENSFAEPRRIYPKETQFESFGETFDYKFPPFSYTVLRIPA